MLTWNNDEGNTLSVMNSCFSTFFICLWRASNNRCSNNWCEHYREMLQVHLSYTLWIWEVNVINQSIINVIIAEVWFSCCMNTFCFSLLCVLCVFSHFPTCLLLSVTHRTRGKPCVQLRWWPNPDRGPRWEGLWRWRQQREQLGQYSKSDVPVGTGVPSVFAAASSVNVCCLRKLQPQYGFTDALSVGIEGRFCATCGFMSSFALLHQQGNNTCPEGEKMWILATSYSIKITFGIKANETELLFFYFHDLGTLRQYIKYFSVFVCLNKY